VAEIVQDVKTIVSQPKAVDVLEIYSECVVRFWSVQFRAPVGICSQIVCIKMIGRARCR
jgi:hypothetical protein